MICCPGVAAFIIGFEAVGFSLPVDVLLDLLGRVQRGWEEASARRRG